MQSMSLYLKNIKMCLLEKCHVEGETPACIRPLYKQKAIIRKSHCRFDILFFTLALIYSELWPIWLMDHNNFALVTSVVQNREMKLQQHFKSIFRHKSKQYRDDRKRGGKIWRLDSNQRVLQFVVNVLTFEFQGRPVTNGSNVTSL